jgi:hypothetical protein
MQVEVKGRVMALEPVVTANPGEVAAAVVVVLGCVVSGVVLVIRTSIKRATDTAIALRALDGTNSEDRAAILEAVAKVVHAERK